MHLYIRADANGKIGTGHIMRCIALAQAWQDQGGEVTFISRCEIEALRQRIIDEGFDFISIGQSHPDPSDLGHTLEILEQLKTQNSKLKTWVVLDGYHFTTEYQQAIHAAGVCLLVIDDMNHLPYYHADILLNQNINAPDLNYHCDEDTTLLLGTRYVLLRREFLKYRDFERQIPDQAKNILVTLGGADPDNVTLKVIEALKLLNEPDITVRIIIGPANPQQESLRNALAAVQFEAELLINPPNMPELMAWADMAVSAGGSTCWELAFMGLPSCLIIIAENQIQVAQYLQEQGVARCFGWFSTEMLSSGIGSLVQDKVSRLQMLHRMTDLLDFHGAHSVIEEMLRKKRL